jgi:hypothetical protein
MPKLRQPPGPDAGAPLSPEVEPLPLDVVIDPQREDVAAMSPEQRALLRALRSELFAREYGHPEHDPRTLLPLPKHKHAAWRQRRRAWLARIWRDDPRVEVDG